MKITATAVYPGPSIYAHVPVIRHTLELRGLENWPTGRLGSTFVAPLFECLPGLNQHKYSGGAPGSLLPCLCDGDGISLGHVVEHVAVELQNVAGFDLSFARGGFAASNGVCDVVYEFEDADVGVEAGKLALELIHRLLPAERGPTNDLPRHIDFSDRLRAFCQYAQARALPVQDRAVVHAARARDIPTIQIRGRVIQLGHGRFQKRMSGSKTSVTNTVSNDIAAHKDSTSRLLRDVGLPVTRHRSVRSADAAVRAAERIGYPVVVKPNTGNMGRGVSVQLTSGEEVRAAFERARQHSSAVIVEKFVPGFDYRMLVINGALVAVAKRVPGHVVGNGVHTIEALVEEANRDPRRGEAQRGMWTKLELDEPALRLIAKLGYTPQTVPPKGEVIYLRAIANTSAGGTAVDVTDIVHPDNREMAIRAARTIGLDITGVDFLTTDISQSYRDTGGVICEINSRPGLRKHMWPAEGKPRDVLGPILDMLFPPGTPARIPIVAITGRSGKKTTACMVARILKMAGHTVGLATRDGVSIDSNRIAKGRLTGPAAARMILLDCFVDAAVLEVTPGDLLDHGFGCDLCDVAAVVNAAPDPTDQRERRSAEALAEAMRVVVASTRNIVVLNADDELCLRMAATTDARRVCYVTMNPDNSQVLKHIGDGHRAVMLRHGTNGQTIAVYDSDTLVAALGTDLLPAARRTNVMRIVQSAMFAVAIAHSMGKRSEDIRYGLSDLSSSAL